MFEAKIKNANGQMLTLTQNESQYQVYKIVGIDPPKAQVNVTQIAGLDGAKLNSTKLNTREIVIYIKLNGDIEANRQYLYKMFRTAEKCTFYFRNQRRNVYIEGVVDTVECDLFNHPEIMQVSIVCPDPYFRDMVRVVADISNTVAGFEFPFSIDFDDPVEFSIYIVNRVTNVENDSESETGVMIDIDIGADCQNIMLKDTDTGATFTLDYAFRSGDEVVINTNKGQKSVTLLRGGSAVNVFSALQSGSTFFQLAVGENHFGYVVDNGVGDEFVDVRFIYTKVYRGV